MISQSCWNYYRKNKESKRICFFGAKAEDDMSLKECIELNKKRLHDLELKKRIIFVDHDMSRKEI